LIVGKGYFPPRVIRKRLMAGFFFLLKFFICNLGKIRSLNQTRQPEKRYSRPTRNFSIPPYQPGMKHCNLNQKYLRPTLYCNSMAPEVIAVAHQLGAYKKSDWEFAESAFEFVKRNINIEIIPLDGVVDTLRRGTGTCLHRVALLVALCREAGIKTRYKLYTLTTMDTLGTTLGDNQPGSEWHDKLGELLYHGEAEVFIDGKWVVGSIGLTPERQASLNLPITKFGEVPLDTSYTADPGSIVQLESIPHGLNFLMKLVYRIAPSAINNANANLYEQCCRGRAILDAIGEQAYDDDARRVFKRQMPDPIIQERKEITFKK
jgi:hypothetical protein